MSEDTTLDNVLDELETEEVEVDEDIIAFASPEWTDHVLSLLTDDEKVKDAPRTEGLTRVARQIYQDFPVEFNIQVHHVSPEYAAVTAAVTVDGVQYIGSAEVHPENTDAPYNKYPLATAETRAIGRAIKRLLCINVITAEETSRVADLTIPKTDENRTEGGVTNTQIKLIERQSKSIDVDVVQAVAATVGQHEKISDLSHAEALKLLKQLDEWKREPPETKLEKFNPNWRENFS